MFKRSRQLQKVSIPACLPGIRLVNFRYQTHIPPPLTGPKYLQGRLGGFIFLTHRSKSFHGFHEPGIKPLFKIVFNALIYVPAKKSVSPFL